MECQLRQNHFIARLDRILQETFGPKTLLQVFVSTVFQFSSVEHVRNNETGVGLKYLELVVLGSTN